MPQHDEKDLQRLWAFDPEYMAMYGEGEPCKQGETSKSGCIPAEGAPGGTAAQDADTQALAYDPATVQASPETMSVASEALNLIRNSRSLMGTEQSRDITKMSNELYDREKAGALTMRDVARVGRVVNSLSDRSPKAKEMSDRLKSDAGVQEHKAKAQAKFEAGQRAARAWQEQQAEKRKSGGLLSRIFG